MREAGLEIGARYARRALWSGLCCHTRGGACKAHLRTRPLATSLLVLSVVGAARGVGGPGWRWREHLVETAGLGRRTAPLAGSQHLEHQHTAMQRDCYHLASAQQVARLAGADTIDAHLARQDPFRGQRPRLGEPCKVEPLVEPLPVIGHVGIREAVVRGGHGTQLSWVRLSMAALIE